MSGIELAEYTVSELMLVENMRTGVNMNIR
jgi:hypothetical protein